MLPQQSIAWQDDAGYSLKKTLKEQCCTAELGSRGEGGREKAGGGKNILVMWGITFEMASQSIKQV